MKINNHNSYFIWKSYNSRESKPSKKKQLEILDKTNERVAVFFKNVYVLTFPTLYLHKTAYSHCTAMNTQSGSGLEGPAQQHGP